MRPFWRNYWGNNGECEYSGEIFPTNTSYCIDFLLVAWTPNSNGTITDFLKPSFSLNARGRSR
jgi:hypothetical protein